MENLTKPAKKSSVKKNDGEKKGKRRKVTEPVNTKESEERQKNKEKREKENAEKQKKKEQKEREKEKKEKERQALAERDNLYLEKLSHIASGSFWDGDDLYAAEIYRSLQTPCHYMKMALEMTAFHRTLSTRPCRLCRLSGQQQVVKSHEKNIECSTLLPLLNPMNHQNVRDVCSWRNKLDCYRGNLQNARK